MGKLWLTASLGPSQEGLATVGYIIRAKDGTMVQSRTTEGVVELGSGIYGAEIEFDESDSYVVVWDNGAEVPRYAHNIVRFDDYAGTPEERILADIDRLKREVQGLKEKNIRKVVVDPADPSRILVTVKRDEAVDWDPENVQEEYEIPVTFTPGGEVERYGG